MSSSSTDGSNNATSNIGAFDRLANKTNNNKSKMMWTVLMGMLLLVFVYELAVPSTTSSSTKTGQKQSSSLKKSTKTEDTGNTLDAVSTTSQKVDTETAAAETLARIIPPTDAPKAVAPPPPPQSTSTTTTTTAQSSHRVGITCGCPDTCTSDILSNSRNQYFSCLQRIKYMKSHYKMSTESACKHASEGPIDESPDKKPPCPLECRPGVCGRTT